MSMSSPIVPDPLYAGPGLSGFSGASGYVAVFIDSTLTIDGQGRLAIPPSEYVKTDGSVPMAAPLSMGGFRIESLGMPSAADDAATKGYADAIAAGVSGFSGSVGPQGSSGYSGKSGVSGF